LSHYTLTNKVRVIEGKIKENDLKGIGFQFELSRIRVTEGKITVNVWSNSRGNQRELRVTEGSSYRESTV